MKKFYYLIHIQYLGFRFHGWAKQTGLKTVHQMVDKTIEFVLPNTNFKTLGASRTDAMVSAHETAFELFLPLEIEPVSFLADLNSNFPPDIRALSIKEVDAEFNIIQSPKTKEYIYLFAHGEKFHPFSASILTCIPSELDIELMKAGAELFQGSHDFRKYCTKPGPNTQFDRAVSMSKIEPNEIFSANFFPKLTYAYRVQSKGFMRNQVRLMMGQLIALGKGEIALTDIRKSLDQPDEKPLSTIAPASGLILYRIQHGD